MKKKILKAPVYFLEKFKCRPFFARFSAEKVPVCRPFFSLNEPAWRILYTGKVMLGYWYIRSASRVLFCAVCASKKLSGDQTKSLCQCLWSITFRVSCQISALYFHSARPLGQAEWHVTHSGGWTFSQNFSLLALIVWAGKGFEDLKEMDDSLNESIN